MKKDIGSFLRALAVAVIATLIAWFFLGGQEIVLDMPSAAQQREKGAIDLYDSLKQQGNKANICLQAGQVAAVFRDAKDDANYGIWQARAKADCAAAEMLKEQSKIERRMIRSFRWRPRPTRLPSISVRRDVRHYV